MSEDKQEGQLNIVTEKVSKASVLRLSGCVEIDSSPGLRQVLHELWKAKSPAVVIDLSAVEHVDTSGLATFIECAQELKKHGGRLILSGASKGIRGRIALAQLETYFTVLDTFADALASLEE